MSSKRNKPSSEMVEVGGTMPSFLTKYKDEDTSHEGMSGYRVLSRIKIIQSMSAEELKDDFGEGAVILAPVKIPVAGKREEFLFTPLFFWPEFLKWADRDDPEETILERSVDPMGDLAAACRDPERREEEYGKGLTAKNSEHLNFAGLVYGPNPGDDPTPCVLGFARGEFGSGKRFITNIGLLNGKPPLWSTIWRFSSEFREKGSKKWWGLNFKFESFISEEQAEAFNKEYDTLKLDHAQRRLMVNYQGEKEEGGGDGEPIM